VALVQCIRDPRGWHDGWECIGRNGTTARDTTMAMTTVVDGMTQRTCHGADEQNHCLELKTTLNAASAAGPLTQYVTPRIIKQ